MKNIFAFLAVGAVIVVGCGGGTSTDTDGGGDGSTPLDGSKPDGATGDGGGSDTGVMDTGVDTGSGNEGGPMDGGVACTKPGDCGNMFCCATFKTAMGQIPACLQNGTYSTMCTQTCTTMASFMCNATNTRRICDMKSQCNENGYGECCSFMFNNQTVSACVSTQESGFIKQMGGSCL